MPWRIWYDDREPFTCCDGPPEDAPSDGVQLVVDYFPNGKRSNLGSDYYAWFGDSWGSGDRADLHGWLRSGMPGRHVKFGRQTTEAEHRGFAKRALRMEAPDCGDRLHSDGHDQ